MNIITNGQARDVIYGNELTLEEQKKFDYIKWDEPDQNNEVHNFFRYKGELYDLEAFMPTYDFVGYDAPDFKGWDGYTTDTIGSGMLIRFVENFERVVVGRYY